MIIRLMTLKVCLMGVIFLAVALNSSTALAVSVKDFSLHPKYYNVKISPDGKHLAALVSSKGKKSLVFLETDSYKITYTLHANSDSQAADYYWVNNERVVIQVEQMRGALEQPLNYGELYAINYDGKKRKMIFGYRAHNKTGRNNTKQGSSAYSGYIIDRLEDDPKHILIQKQEFSRNANNLAKVAKLNIYSGREKLIKTAPMPYGSFLIDNKGYPRFSSGTDESHKSSLFYNEGKGKEWKKFADNIAGKFSPIAFAQDNESIFAFKSTDGTPQGVYKYNLKTYEEELLYRSEIADPTDAMKSGLGNVYGLRIDEDYPKYVYFDDKNQDAQLHKALYGFFRGDKVAITSKTVDNKTFIIHVSGDRNPGAFYSFDLATMKPRLLFNAVPQIKPEEMAPVEPFRINTSDGLTLNGYVTLPKGKSKNLPTVILPHGGPHARDYWGYNPQVQMLANAGYAVVQVNFRGSTGYGQNFEEAGWGHWGTKIQDDIILATNYMVQQGISDKNRMCIFGTSFGGYSALQAAIRKPNLFKCTIGYAGVYDLPMLYNEGDIKTRNWGDAYLDKTLGKDVAVQKSQSPVYHVDKLKAPVLLIHGEDDQRAPIDHAEKLREMLEAKNHPFEWLVKDKEGHGFYDEENIMQANETILAFLAKHIGT